MTTIITRLFKDEKAARNVKDTLHRERLPKRAVEVITADESEDADALAARMERAMVHEDAAPTYAKKVKGGNALLVVRATYKPLGVAQITRGILADADTVAVDAGPDDYFVPDGPQKGLSILEDHPRFLTVPVQPGERRSRTISEQFGLRLLSPRKPRTSAISGGRYMSRFFWPMPLVTHKKRSLSVYKGGRHMSRAFWPAPLITRKPRGTSVIHGGDLPLSRYMGWKTISRRD